jgi:hypothetical protein
MPEDGVAITFVPVAFVGVVGVPIDQIVDVLSGVLGKRVAAVWSVGVIRSPLVDDVLLHGMEDPSAHRTAPLRRSW